MSRTRVKNTDHAYIRAKERTNIPKRRVKQMMKEAQTAGIAWGNLPPGPIREYIRSKGNNKRVKLYQNYVFVFANSSTACITMYPLDETIIEAQKKFDDKNRNY